MDDDFIAAYPTTDNASLAASYGVSPVTILKWARRLGLRKTPEHRAEAQRRRMLGRRLSAKTRAKIGAKAAGRVLSAETKAKILQTKLRNGTLPKGERHYKWKGGQTWRRFKDPRYISWHSPVLERDDYTCRHCGRRCKKYERGLAAHHVRPYATNPELRFEVSNGITLCRACHLALHRRGPKPKKPAPCACGCGMTVKPFDCYGRPRRFVNHHHRRKE